LPVPAQEPIKEVDENWGYCIGSEKIIFKKNFILDQIKMSGIYGNEFVSNV